MIDKYSIVGKSITLKRLNSSDDLSNYLEWMNDTEINEFLESRSLKYTLTLLQQYINDSNKSEFEELMGIFDNDSGCHIGNVKISEINPIHNFAYIGIVVGIKSFWGKGVASEAINLMTRFAFDKLCLNKLVAGIYVNNIGSIKAFENSGFEIIGTMRQHRVYKGSYVDQHLLELINHDKQK